MRIAVAGHLVVCCVRGRGVGKSHGWLALVDASTPSWRRHPSSAMTGCDDALGRSNNNQFKLDPLESQQTIDALWRCTRTATIDALAICTQTFHTARHCTVILLYVVLAAGVRRYTRALVAIRNGFDEGHGGAFSGNNKRRQLSWSSMVSCRCTGSQSRLQDRRIKIVADRS